MTGGPSHLLVAAFVTVCGAVVSGVAVERARGDGDFSAKQTQSAATISGRVISAETREPIEGAVVTASVLPLNRPAGTPPPPPTRVRTDVNGLFEIRDLPAGVLNLSATAKGFLTDVYRPGLQSQLPSVRAGQILRDITLALARGAVIAGSVRDSSGRPIPQVEVQVFRRGILTVRRAWIEIRRRVITDAEGRFHADALQPGEYVVSVPVTATTFSKNVFEAVKDIPRAEFEASPIGAAMRESRAPVPDPYFPAIAKAESLILMTAGLVTARVPTPRKEGETFRTTYYPRAATLDSAGIITLASGDTREDVDIEFQQTIAYRVAGQLQSEGRPKAFTGLYLIAEDASERSIDYDGVVGLTVSDQNGGFAFDRVPPGNYSVKVALLPAKPGEGNPVMPPASRATGWISERITVTDGDLTLPPMSIQPPLTISGRVEFDGAGAMSPAQTGKSTVWMAAVDGGMYSPPSAVPIASDGTFVLKGAMRGRYHLWGGTYAGWTVRKVTAAGQDITGKNLVVNDKNIDDVVIALTPRPVLLEGRIINSEEFAGVAAAVLIFPADHVGWIAGGMSNRVMRRIRADSTGRFGVSGLPPGLYRIAALPEEATQDWPDRRLFESIAASSEVVVLTEGKPAAIQIRLTKRERK